MSVSTVYLMILAAITAALVSAALRNVAYPDDHSCYRPAPRDAVVQALLSVSHHDQQR